MSLRERAPPICPRCGYDPTGDDVEFTSGGGWEHDHEIMDGEWRERFKCPNCRETVVAQPKQQIHRGP